MESMWYTRILQHVLLSNRSLAELKLKHNQLGVGVAFDIAAAFNLKSSAPYMDENTESPAVGGCLLKSLDLDGNSIGDDGVAALFEVRVLEPVKEPRKNATR